MKRLDLIFSERELDDVLSALEKAEVPGYTVMKHATGRGPERIVTEDMEFTGFGSNVHVCLLYTSPSPRDRTRSRMPSSA